MNNDIFNKIRGIIECQKLNVVDEDIKKPWGGFFVINEKDIQFFSKLYFNEIDINELNAKGKLSPKILIIFSQKRLSWQYHLRRSEILKVKRGSIQLITSHDDIERKKEILNEGEKKTLKQGERHRIVGTSDYAIVAEIWIHTDKDNPSDENDIVRIQDDYDR